MSGEVFNAYAAYYDLLYKDKDYAQEANYVDALVRRFRPEARSVLELGSGTGRHARLLAAKGYTVHGIERSGEMLDQARKQAAGGDGVQFTHGDIRSARVENIFDVAVSLFHVISYQTSNNDLQAAFATARAHLRAGGLFLFDCWHGPAVLTDRPTVRIKTMEDDRISVTRIAEPVLRAEDNVVEVNYHLFLRDRTTGVVEEIRETHPMRYLFKTELTLLLEEAALRILHSEEWLSGRPPGFDTWGVCYLAEAV